MRRTKPPQRTGAPDKVPWASFADALTGLLFVFILLTLSFAHKLKKAETAFNRKFDDAEREREKWEERLAARERVLAALVGERGGPDDAPTRFLTCLRTGQGNTALMLLPRADPEAHRIALRLPGSQAWFDEDQAAIRTADTQRVDLVAGCLTAFIEEGHLNQGNGHTMQLRVLVEGHTDTLRAGGRWAGSNWELSGARAARFVETMLASRTANLPTYLDNGSLELVPAGLEATVPARRELCTEEPEDEVCVCLTLSDWQYGECAHSFVQTLPDNATTASQADQVKAWGNATELRRGLNRRVGLRFEVTERNESGTAG